MNDNLLGEQERRELNEQVRKVLRDLGNPEPPIDLGDVRKLLKLDLSYYDGTSTGLIAELTHRTRLLTKKSIPEAALAVRDIIAKSKLVAFWVPESRRVLIDSSIHSAKHRWIEGHEITHSLTPWHRDLLLGDDNETLDPVCRAMIEAEANYGAGQLLFLHDRFAREARAMDLTIDSARALSRRFSNSITSTLWKLVEERDPSQAVFGLISIHPRVPTLGAHGGKDPWRYFIRSDRFKTQFSNLMAPQAYALVERHASFRRNGPVLSATDEILDVAGVRWEVKIESFSNSYALLTLGSVVRKCAVLSAATG